MSEVFISYRQTNDEQRQRVRAFAERLRDAGITVVLDQIFLDDHPAGPDDGWDKWSSDRALNSEYVLIIGTKEWFDCFEKKQPSGTGLGAACEADDLRHRIYEAGGVIGNIRVVLFDEADAVHIPGKLKRYHRFHAERDFTNIVRWLGGKLIINAPRTSIPHNLPALQPFFGREEELKTIADALNPESRTWGALINGPGGIGKTSLAIRAAYDAPADAFDKIVFISLKSRMLDDDGERDLSGFLISGLAQLLNELARELGHNEIAQTPEEQRPRLLHDALRGTHTLLVLDNLESLVKRERDVIFTFVDKLPMGCKAILTARGRIGSGGKEIILQKLREKAALATLAELAENNSALRRTSEADRLLLYRETGGNPLLLRWTAGQVGRGSCLTLGDAIDFLRSCPKGNDPLEFIFGNLVEDLSNAETDVLCALIYFALPAKIEHVFGPTESSEVDADHALGSLVNRSLILPSEELETFVLVPLVADFLRKKKPEEVVDAGDRLEKRAYVVVLENGYQKYERFPVLDAAWPMIAAALPRFLTGPNDRLQTICKALFQFCSFTGRYDESLALNTDAEKRAVSTGDYFNAGLRAYQVGWIHRLRQQAEKVLEYADRIDAHWSKVQIDTEKRALIIRLRGIGHALAANFSAAIVAYREAAELLQNLGLENQNLATILNNLAEAERLSNDFAAAERDYNEALRIVRVVGDEDGIATLTGNLALLALGQKNWPGAEILAREALSIAEKIGRQELIALTCRHLARALAEQGKKSEGVLYAQRAVDIFTRLSSPRVSDARKTLAECQG